MPKDVVNRNAPFYGALLVGLLAMTFGLLEYVNVTASRSRRFNLPTEIPTA